jgi:pantothenate kinase
MDGFHYTKEQLSRFPNATEAFARRGAHWTFDGAAFVEKLRHLRVSGSGSFPSFSHGSGDPVADDVVVVAGGHRVVLVEGNYLLLDVAPWSEIRSLLDFVFFIEADLQTIRERVYGRHFSLGYGEEVSLRRVLTNDLPNAEIVLATKHRADKIIQSR